MKSDNSVFIYTTDGNAFHTCAAIEDYFSDLSKEQLLKEMKFINKVGQIEIYFDANDNVQFRKVNPYFDEGHSFSVLTDDEVEIPEFHEDLMIPGVKEFAIDVAHRMNNASLVFMAVATLLAMSASIGRKVLVRPKQHDNFSIVPTLWGMLIAPPSYKKTPLYSAALRPLDEMEKEAYITYEEELKEFKKQENEYKSQWKLYEKSEKSEKPKTIPKAPSMPVRKRYISNDATVESLSQILIDNPSGILITLDELSGFFATLGKSGREADRAFYLEAFSGKGSKSIDRVGSGSTYVPNVSASIAGTIQPDSLNKLITKTVSGSSGGDGLLQRFQLMVMLTEPTFKYVDKAPDFRAEKNYYNLIRTMSTADPIEFGAHFDEDKYEIYYRFSEDATAIYEMWMNDNYEKVAAENEINPALSSHLSKYDSLFVSIALIYFYADKVRGLTMETEISDTYVLRAWDWCTYLEGHARAVYDLGKMKKEEELQLRDKLIKKLIELKEKDKLPIAFGKLGGMVAKTNARLCRRLLSGKVVVEKKRIVDIKNSE